MRFLEESRSIKRIKQVQALFLKGIKGASGAVEKVLRKKDFLFCWNIPLDPPSKGEFMNDPHGPPLKGGDENLFV